MALRRQNLSPTSNLLRNSRLFSLPNPLPRPSIIENSGSGTLKASDSATLPYPTHQAIATTPRSLARGDWGLKRPLPSRSYLVQTSNPVLRINQLDTIEHVTDFDSAGDHVRTRQKWEEMGIPMVKGLAQMSDHDLTATPVKSAFEKGADVTVYEEKEGLDEDGMFFEALKKSSTRNAREAAKKSGSAFTPFSPPQGDVMHRTSLRWKHDGPFLPGMDADDFLTYISKQVSTRQKEFNKYLEEYVKNEIYTKRQVASRQSAIIPLDPQEAEEYHAEHEKQWSAITKEDIDAGIRALRRETAADPLNSKLVQKLIVPFLRLPPIRVKSTSFSADRTSHLESHKFSEETAPSSTHPSAGLGYLRTNAYLSNHPILGPQALPAPVTARVIQPRQTATTTNQYARLGVAGFVTNDEFRNVSNVQSRNSNNDVDRLDIETVGGAKVFVQPQFGAVTPTGRVHIKVKRGFGAEVAVARGELEDRPPQREHVQSNPIANLLSVPGESGAKELDAQSGNAQVFFSVMEEQLKQGQQQKKERDTAVPRAPEWRQ